jgi:hypothetical protein
MLLLLKLLLGSFRRLFSSRRNLWLENLAMRQQLMVFNRRRSRPKIGDLDRLFWLVARCFWVPGGQLSSSSLLKRQCVGIESASASIGVGSPAMDKRLVASGSVRNCAI